MDRDLPIADTIFEQFLKGKKLSSTSQRFVILQEVFRNHSHFGVEEILNNLKKKKKNVSRATLYRTMTYLEESGLIRKIDLGHGHAHYEHTHGHSHHEHLYCQVCGKIIEIQDEELEKRIDTCAQNHHFSITNHTVQIFGTCQKCTPIRTDVPFRPSEAP